MSFITKVLGRANPKDKTVKYYLVKTQSHATNQSSISKLISDKTTLTQPDVIAVLSSLQKWVMFYLAQGYRVDLGEFASFKTTIKSKKVTAAQKNPATSIDRLHVVMRPKAGLKDYVSLSNQNVNLTIAS